MRNYIYDRELPDNSQFDFLQKYIYQYYIDNYCYETSYEELSKYLIKHATIEVKKQKIFNNKLPLDFNSLIEKYVKYQIWNLIYLGALELTLERKVKLVKRFPTN